MERFAAGRIRHSQEPPAVSSTLWFKQAVAAFSRLVFLLLNRFGLNVFPAGRPSWWRSLGGLLAAFTLEVQMLYSVRHQYSYDLAPTGGRGSEGERIAFWLHDVSPHRLAKRMNPPQNIFKEKYLIFDFDLNF